MLLYRKLIFLFGLTMLAVLLLAGCASANSPGSPAELKAALGQEFTLPAGQTVNITGENLSLKFDSLISDSRCPKGVVCVWAGEAKCQMQITYLGSVSTVVFTVPGGSAGMAEGFVNGYRAGFSLVPYPEAGKSISAGDYQLVMTVSK